MTHSMITYKAKDYPPCKSGRPRPPKRLFLRGAAAIFKPEELRYKLKIGLLAGLRFFSSSIRYGWVK